MESIRRGNVLIETYSSMGEYADTAEVRAREAVRSDDEGEWSGGSWTNALKLARNGWDEEMRSTMDIAEEAVKTAEMEYLDDGFSAVWDVSGAEVDMGRYLAKVPECMIDYPLTKVIRVGRVVTLVAGRSVSCGVETDTMIRMGQVTTALALALDRLGLSTEIYVDTSQEDYARPQHNMCQRILVKGASDSLDASAIQFALAHPAFFRRLAFGTWDAMGDKNDTFTKAFGQDSFSRGTPARRPDAFKAMYPEGSIFFPMLRSSGDVPNADEFLRKHLRDLGLIGE